MHHTIIRYLDNNCLIQSQIPSYQSPNVTIYNGTNQERCLNGTCVNKKLRESGCFLCSNTQHGGEICMTCIEDYLLFYGKCVKCLSTEVCPFNNTNTTKCIDGDYSHCGFGKIGCNNHKCDMRGNDIMIVVFSIVVFGVIFAVCIIKYMEKNKPPSTEETTLITQNIQ